MSWKNRRAKKKSFKVDGVKIKNAKKKTVDGINFKSSLEAFCYSTLKAQGITNFQYEGHTFVLLNKFTSNTSGLEVYNKTEEYKSRGKMVKKLHAKFGEVTNNIRAITYTPDFVSIDPETKMGWIIETKGFSTGEFKLKWKMFKHWLLANGYTISLYTPNNQENTLKSIASIKSKYYT